jgi:hypothetical protein
MAGDDRDPERVPGACHHLIAIISPSFSFDFLLGAIERGDMWRAYLPFWWRFHWRSQYPSPYALILRELQRINANLEQFIKLVVDARQREDARQDDV